jgi:hypothetical protein
MELVAAFGADRVLAGSDYPFVRGQEGGYGGAFAGPLWDTRATTATATRTGEVVVSVGQGGILSSEDRALVLRGSAEKMFGPWPL